jgi:hypothetical protein
MNLITDQLVIRGTYTTLSLCVYGTVSTTAPRPPSVPIPSAVHTQSQPQQSTVPVQLQPASEVPEPSAASATVTATPATEETKPSVATRAQQLAEAQS